MNRYRNDAQQFGYGDNTADKLGIPGINGIPWTSGPPQIDLANFGDPFIGFSASLPWIRAETNVLFTNIWTKTKGNHTIKFGGRPAARPRRFAADANLSILAAGTNLTFRRLDSRSQHQFRQLARQLPSGRALNARPRLPGHLPRLSRLAVLSLSSRTNGSSLRNSPSTSDCAGNSIRLPRPRTPPVFRSMIPPPIRSSSEASAEIRLNVGIDKQLQRFRASPGHRLSLGTTRPSSVPVLASATRRSRTTPTPITIR